MRITDIKVFPVREEKLKAFISIVLDECFMVNDIKVIKGKEGFFISMPSRRKRNGKFKDIAHPLNNETRQAMEMEILAAYEGELAGTSEAEPQVKARPTGGGEVEKPRSEPRRREPVAAEVEAVEPPVVESESVPKPESRPEVEPQPSARKVDGDAPGEGEDDSAGGEGADKSLEEVTELHLRDSFWGT
ncbi:MAG: septation regulator SpoVG [bacterium]|nr:septation regulator SpoVG [bacterium]